MANAMIILECQPPHVGHILAIQAALEEYDFVYIYVIDKEYVMKTTRAVSILQQALRPYENFRTYKTDMDFTSVGGLPESMVEQSPEVILVADKHIFTHLNSLGMPVNFLGHVKGYSDLFSRVAFRQGLAKDYLAQYVKY